MKQSKNSIYTSFLILSILCFSCKPTEKTSKTNFTSSPVIFTEINSGTNGGFNEINCRTVINQADFNNVWSTAFDKFSAPPKPPRIDFESKMVILVSMGMKNSGGYSTKIKNIVEEEEHILVTIVESSPGNKCATTDVITFPYQLIELRRITKKIEVVYEKKTFNCD